MKNSFSSIWRPGSYIAAGLSLSFCVQTFAATPTESGTPAKSNTPAKKPVEPPAVALTLAKELQAAEKAFAFEKENLDPDDQALANCKLWLAQLYVQSRQDAKAEPLLLQVLEFNEKKHGAECPEVAEAADALGQAYEHLGKTQEAKSRYQQALTVREKLNDLLVYESLERYGKLLYKLGETNEAQKCFSQLKEMQKADRAYSVALQIDQNNQAVSAINAKKYSEAISILENLVRYHPSYGLARENLVIAYDNYGRTFFSAKKDPAKTELYFKKTIDTNRLGRTTEQKLKLCLSNLAIVLQKEKKYSEAFDVSTRLICLGCDDGAGYHHRGKALAALNRNELAIIDLTECIKQNAMFSTCSYRHRADCYEKLGKVDLAKEDRKKAKQVDDDDAQVKG